MAMAASSSLAATAVALGASSYSSNSASSCSSSHFLASQRRKHEAQQNAAADSWSSASSALLGSGLPSDQILFSCGHWRRSVRRSCSGVAFASAAEPKWKQKLAAADQHAEQTRQMTMQAQEEYRKRQEALRRQQAGATGDLTSLADLEFIPYLTEEGLVTDCSSPEAKATVYAIFGEDKALEYIGVSRQVLPSLRLHFARMPMKCFYLKVQHVTKPNRALLESIRDKWIAENGSVPDGNDNGERQNIWENPLDCKPLMLESEKEMLAQAAAGPPSEKILKNVARRIEKDLETSFKLRNCKERLRFDPKLKDRGLLDIKNTPPRPLPKATTVSVAANT